MQTVDKSGLRWSVVITLPPLYVCSWCY